MTVCIAQVQAGGLQSEPFEVTMGVKQGFVLAPVLFNIFLLAVYHLTHAALGEDAGIGVQFRLDGNLFNLRRLQAHTKTSITRILELQYADDCAIVAHDHQALQRSLNVFHRVYSSLGLQVNTQKTEINAQLLTPHWKNYKIVEQFTYLGSTSYNTTPHHITPHHTTLSHTTPHRPLPPHTTLYHYHYHSHFLSLQYIVYLNNFIPLLF